MAERVFCSGFQTPQQTTTRSPRRGLGSEATSALMLVRVMVWSPVSSARREGVLPVYSIRMLPHIKNNKAYSFYSVM